MAKGIVVAILALAAASTTTVSAADLPPREGFGAPLRTVRQAGLPPYLQRPYFAEASRFDIYGYPVVSELPNPLYASTGCPANLEPVYDATGNFAGYHPKQACR